MRSEPGLGRLVSLYRTEAAPWPARGGPAWTNGVEEDYADSVSPLVVKWHHEIDRAALVRELRRLADLIDGGFGYTVDPDRSAIQYG